MEKILLSILFAVLLGGSATAQETSADKVGPKVRSEILKLDAEQNTAAFAGDGATTDRIVGDDVLWTGRDGKLSTKMQLMDDFSAQAKKRGANGPLPNKHEDIRIHAYGNFVVVSGRSVSMIRDKDGKEIPTSRVGRYTNTYLKRDGRWVIVAHQATDVSEK